MKLYISDMNGKKRYLSVVAVTRNELAHKLGGAYFSIDGTTYHISPVYAERSNDNTPISTVIGGALGLFGGMPGVLVGGVLGALLGNEADKQESIAIESFNRSLS